MKRFWKAMLALVMIGSVLAGTAAILYKLRNMHNETYDILYQLQTSSRDLRNTMLLNDQQMDDFLIDHQQHYTFDDSWVEKAGPLAAHALGGIDGETYTNSLDAFEFNYAQGYRVFEVDFDFTEEYSLVGSHGMENWKQMTGGNLPFTLQNVLNTPLHGKYQAVDYRKIIDLMAEHPDMYVITDIKTNDYVDVMLVFSTLVKYASEHAPQVLNRIIPQIYQMEMLDWVMSIHPFRSVIFTLYRANWTREQLVEFCRASGVGILTIHYGGLTDELLQEWSENGIRIGAYTLNDEATAHALLEKGADLIYTDFLMPSAFAP